MKFILYYHTSYVGNLLAVLVFINMVLQIPKIDQMIKINSFYGILLRPRKKIILFSYIPLLENCFLETHIPDGNYCTVKEGKTDVWPCMPPKY